MSTVIPIIWVGIAIIYFMTINSAWVIVYTHTLALVRSVNVPVGICDCSRVTITNQTADRVMRTTDITGRVGMAD